MRAVSLCKAHSSQYTAASRAKTKAQLRGLQLPIPESTAPEGRSIPNSGLFPQLERESEEGREMKEREGLH